MSTAAPAAVSGQFEVSPEKFFEMTKDRAQDIHAFDLREILPELFPGGSDRVPRLLHRVWRRSCDEVIAENRGIYAPKGTTQVQIFFFELDPSVARAKVSIVKGKVPTILKAAQTNESVLDTPVAAPQRAAPKEQEKQGTAAAIAALAKEGLPDNPELAMVQLWASRALQNMVTANQKIPLTREMIDLAGKTDISYFPLWNAPAQAIVGSCLHVRASLPAAQQKPGEPFRQDLAGFFGAAFQLYSMQSKGASSLVVVPVRAATLADKETCDLWTALLKRMSPETRKNLIVEVRGAPKDVPPQSFSAAVNSIMQQARAVTFETGILAYADFTRNFPKLHACGFDSAEAHIGEHEQVRLMKKFGEHYAHAGLKPYVKNVSSPYVRDAALLHNYAYITGPVIRPGQKTCFPAQKLTAAELKA
jgi:hypothetical protein